MLRRSHRNFCEEKKEKEKKEPKISHHSRWLSSLFLLLSLLMQGHHNLLHP
jgi:hypothetical protein